ncbi:GtrA family protein [Bradyrhizobium sp. CCGUVB14]|uniref:GtrA family protein n=1 Tax=Bradyrhizobium sp. CCGUVB14 TaxID=2949628 RepID=UPI0020B2B847|nr:GtrA family protein [Bradyrhizobium sp. CCGUVB14]MCP3445127.1 GtrA family protein [Bradyrhizobium sp. CCGUVB14]
MKILAFPSWEMLRFAAVIVTGLAVDLTTAFGVTAALGLPMAAGVAAGFFVGALFNYVCHELWTFREKGRALSAHRASLYLMSAVLVLCVRVLVASSLSPWAASLASRFAVLIAAAGVSFVVNYLLSRFMVYRRVSSRCWTV